MKFGLDNAYNFAEKVHNNPSVSKELWVITLSMGAGLTVASTILLLHSNNIF